MIVTFAVPSSTVPIGGVALIYEFADGLARRGHVVHLVHHELLGTAFESIDDLTWYDFEGPVRHRFPGPGALDPRELPDADVHFGFAGDDYPARTGLPVVLIQGRGIMGDDFERYAFEAPCPKVCIAAWLVDVGVDMGLPAREFVHIPLGLRHQTFRTMRPPEKRRPSLAFLYAEHPKKGAEFALEVVTRLRSVFDDLPILTFGAVPLPTHWPAYVEHRVDPPVDELVAQVYNETSVFMCPSSVEGFGYPSVEAMACGAALVTTDNGGSSDFALPGETALVCEPDDLDAMTANIAALLSDEARRVRMARAGREFVQRFRWDTSIERLELFLADYLERPAYYRSGREPVRKRVPYL